ncbi:GNAT family N-acetyltransferase [Candidatus Colwellia aromaticivorans]|uniref:GNAT family N-acetyltransferase n=1 Tax=Candidatus Colwellia aromaticivorans TaxID=2267621 RepID=UPI000DF12764|nr:N-acetyltransferase [Candidatus Colwellia aromaticivorans]
MNQNVNIRPESDDDINAIEKITIEAFKSHPHSNQTEHEIVAKLRNDNALSVSLVAEVNNVVVGHIAFSKVKINDEFIEWYGLAPVSVKPEYQSQGVGSQLILSGLNAIRELNAKGCVLLGEPEYYKRFGFKALSELVFEGVPPEYFQSLLLGGDMPNGNIEYHKAFA